MNYDHRPVGDLIRGPLLHTPQGLVVLASVVVYACAALAGAHFGVSSAFAKTPSVFFTICLVWPFITFLFYVRANAPSFSASLAGAGYVAIVALAPLAFGAWRMYV